MHRGILVLSLASLLLPVALPAVQADAQSLAGIKIALDPGHGGTDGGSSGFGLLEKTVVLDVALRARDLLEAEGATVLLTRDCDCTTSLQTRVDVANNNAVDRFLSVHANNCGGCGGAGTETYYHTSLGSTSTSAKLAGLVQEEVVAKLGTTSRGLKQADFFVLRNTAMPAALVELGFLDHAGDNAKLASEQGRQDAARALLHAVQRHYAIAPHDPEPPQAFEVALVAPAAGGWLRGVVQAEGTTNQDADLAWFRFLVDGSVAKWATAAPHTWAWDTTEWSDGSHELKAQGKNAAGEVASDARTLKLDNTAPRTTRSLEGVAGSNGWWRSTVTASLGCTDAASGCAATTYALDGPGRAYAGPFPIAGDGAHALSYGSRDAAGNAEAFQAVSIQVDATPPATTAALDGTPGSGGWWRSAVTLGLQCRDATSGCDATTWSLDGGAPQRYDSPVRIAGDGTHTLAFSSTDRAGNADAEQSLEVRIDTTPPQVALARPQPGRAYVLDQEAPPPVALPATLVVGDLTVAAQASDATSGVARVEFRVDGTLRAVVSEAPYAWVWSAGAETLGDHTVEATGVDHAGNVSQGAAQKVTTVPTGFGGVLRTLP